MTEFRLMTDGEVQESERLAALDEEQRRWWAMTDYLCRIMQPDAEHPWLLSIEEGVPHLYCQVCDKRPIEEYDFHDMWNFGPVPVTYHVNVSTYNSFAGHEYDIEIWSELR